MLSLDSDCAAERTCDEENMPESAFVGFDGANQRQLIKFIRPSPTERSLPDFFDERGRRANGANLQSTDCICLLRKQLAYLGRRKSDSPVCTENGTFGMLAIAGGGVGDVLRTDVDEGPLGERIEQAFHHRRRHTQSLQRLPLVVGVSVRRARDVGVLVVDARDRVRTVAAEQLGGEPCQLREHDGCRARSEHHLARLHQRLRDV